MFVWLYFLGSIPCRLQIARHYRKVGGRISAIVKRINRYFKKAIKRDIEYINEQLFVTDQQAAIFRMRYLENKSIVAISEELHCSVDLVNTELRIIRSKLDKII